VCQSSVTHLSSLARFSRTIFGRIGMGWAASLALFEIHDFSLAIEFAGKRSQTILQICGGSQHLTLF
jgi:hypothetical protein